MKSTKIISTLLFTFLLLLSSCQKDDGISERNQQQENIPDTFSEYFGNQTSRDFLGNVIDTNNNPIEGVTITIGNETALTDSNGVFIIRDANVNERFGYIKAEKAGYIHGSRSVVPSNGTNKVTIMLLNATVVGSVSSGSSETVTANDGSSVSFDGNFIKEDGSAYSGSVDVIMHHLDPADEDMTMQMPGMLYAQNEDGAERMLQTLGMLAVELRGSGGEDLNLAEGSTSEIKIPVDASLMNIAPATIPLWYFDEVNGYWKEEGVATLQGNMYVGTVSHFSFWNCDIPAEAVNLCVIVTDEDGNVLNNVYINLTSSTLGSTSTGTTNEIGEVCGYIPRNESLVSDLIIYIPELCGSFSLHTETVGPFNTDSSISIIVPNSPEVLQETVIGTLNTCNGNAVTNGYIEVTYDDITFNTFVDDGDFEFDIPRCANSDLLSFTINGYDYDNIESTNPINYTFTTPNTNLGSLPVCDDIDEFIHYSIDGGSNITFLNNISSNFVDGITQIANLSISSFLNDSCFYLMGNINSDGTYIGTYTNLDDITSLNSGMALVENCIDVANNLNNNIIYNFTAVGDIGEYIDINFGGSYEDDDGNPHTINGVVHVLRDN